MVANQERQYLHLAKNSKDKSFRKVCKLGPRVYSVLASLEPRSSTRNEHDSLTNITKKSNNFPYNFLSNNLVFSDELSSIKTFNRSSISFVKEVPMFHKHHLAKQCKVGLTYCTLTLDLWNNVFLQLLLFGSTVHVSVVTITVVVSFVSPA